MNFVQMSPSIIVDYSRTRDSFCSGQLKLPQLACSNAFWCTARSKITHFAI